MLSADEPNAPGGQGSLKAQQLTFQLRPPSGRLVRLGDFPRRHLRQSGPRRRGAPNSRTQAPMPLALDKILKTIPAEKPVIIVEFIESLTGGKRHFDTTPDRVSDAGPSSPRHAYQEQQQSPWPQRW